MASVLIDFYNLHLARGVRNELLPSEDEQQRIRKFFEIHVPDVIKKLTEEEKQKILKNCLNYLNCLDCLNCRIEPDAWRFAGLTELRDLGRGF